MTDKQIITKDVDARGCKFFKNGICASPINPKCKLCVEISEKMCYYKQLKRKEQELEEVCKAFDIEYAIDKETGNLFGRCNKLYKKEQECEELKEEINLLRQYKGSKQASYENMQAEWNNAVSQNRDLLKQVEKWQEKYNKLEAEIDKKELIFAGIETSNRLLIEKKEKFKQTLTEIKYIAEENIRIADLEGLNGVYRRGLAKQILQKISECEGNND